jgi:hypothetical protein
MMDLSLITFTSAVGDREQELGMFIENVKDWSDKEVYTGLRTQCEMLAAACADVETYFKLREEATTK